MHTSAKKRTKTRATALKLNQYITMTPVNKFVNTFISFFSQSKRARLMNAGLSVEI